MSKLQINTKHVTRILDGLFDCETFAKETDSASDREFDVVAMYSETNGDNKYAITCELEIANSLGAALTRIPAASAKEGAKAGIVPENIRPNLYEVLNICSSILADVDGGRVVLDEMFVPGDERYEEVKQEIASATTITNINYEVDRYSEGIISLLKVT